MCETVQLLNVFGRYDARWLWNAFESGRSPEAIGYCEEHCASIRESDLSVLWSPVRHHEPRKRQRMHRCAATRGGWTPSSPGSTQPECTARGSRRDGIGPCDAARRLRLYPLS